ncbi:HAMP domain-containing sensor histidine kinase [Oscillibacter sp.]|uniref:sensor histidine kinase n=1 Tax=Oscillibacter sp. TaxID=1945593 RepID=UPI00289ECFF4|nr:HAMP domain-containing sensor histidine kinase [Oscillibacter sp.]
MIKRLQIKFVCIMMGVLFLVFTVLVATLNIFVYMSNAEQTDNILRMVAEQDGMEFLLPPGRTEEDAHQEPLIPPRFDSQSMRAARLFFVKLDKQDQVLQVQHDMMFGFTQEEAVSYSEAVLLSGKERGSYDDYQYLVAEKDYGKIVVFVENSRELKILDELIFISMIVTAVTCVLLLGFSVLLSKWVVKPVKATFAKQRQFVSDASHELKTPLTIISANVDVLENEIGENIRLQQIRDQADRMTRLVHDLLALARADEGANQLVATEFDLSRAVLSTLLAFESQAFEDGKSLDFNVAEGLRYTGGEPQIKQLVAILMDNAIKHSGKGDEIKVTLRRENEKSILAIYNTGDGIPEQEKDRIFERFYRSDASRSTKTGGYGLGLAIAKSLVELHKGKISVSGKEGAWTCFTVTL